jgi:adenylosuccinate synthase
MKADLVIGALYGSEAKGMACADLAMRHDYDMAISINSCQAGHTSYYDNGGEMIKIVNRQLPSAFPYVNKIVIGAGAMIKPHVLKEEIESLENRGFKIRDKLYIDGQTGITEDNAGDYEKQLVKDIGSTGEGVGWSISERVMRKGRLVKDVPEIREFGTVCDVWKLFKQQDNILVEGCQGFGLSLYHSFYPKCTSRDTGVGALISGAGIPPKSVNHIYGVARTFPIRVGTVVKSSGPMYKEIDWDTVTKESGSKVQIIEKTTVTGRVRRVGRWDDELIKKSVYMNSIDSLILTFINYINAEDRDKLSYNELSDDGKAFIDRVNDEICRVSFASTSPYSMFEVHKEV